MCFRCSGWAGVDEMETPEASAAVLSSVRVLILVLLFGRYSSGAREDVLIFLTNFEDNTVTVTGGVYVFSFPTFFFCVHSPPTLLQINA